MQATTLMETMIAQRRAEEFAEAYAEAWERGPHWRDAIRSGLGMIDAQDRQVISEGITAGIKRLDLDPTAFGLSAL